MDEIKKILLELLDEDKSITSVELEKIISRFDISDEQTDEILLFAHDNGLISLDEEIDTSLYSQESVKDAFSLYRKDLSEFDTIDYLTELKLAQRIQKGDQQAKEQLIEANLRLVYKIAQKSSYNDPQLLMDLIQEGNIGLTVAAEKFDPSKGNRFSTYAVFWIQKYIYSFINNNQQIVIPEKTYLRLKNIRSITEELQQKLLRVPSYDEVANKLGISTQQLLKTLEYEFGYTSLDDMLIDVASEKEDSDELTKQLLQDIIETLDDEKDKLIIKMYLGMDNYPESNYQQIGKVLHMSKQAVGQRFNKAIKKIKENYDK